ncbi:MAG TPA: hypothetical protein VH439_08460 [Gemmatimonadales bacterium]
MRSTRSSTAAPSSGSLDQVNAIVPWALGQIGDKRAVAPLVQVLDEDSPTVRVLAI